MKDWSSIQSQTIDWLRFPLIVLVVFLHNPGLPPDYSLPMLGNDGLAVCLTAYTKVFFSHVLSHVAVPIYFFISGYLFFAKTPVLTKEVYLSKLKSRWHTLMVPYLLWIAIPILLALCIWLVRYIIIDFNYSVFLTKVTSIFRDNGGIRLLWDCKQWGLNVINWIGTPVIESGPYNYPLWFVRDLMVVVLLSPVIYILIKRLSYWFILILLSFYFSGIWLSISGFSSTATLFFSCGAYIAIQQSNIIIEFRKVEIPCYILFIITLFADTFFDGKYTTVGFNLYHLFVVCGIVATFNIVSRFVEKGRIKANQFLTKSVMFVFALHATILINIYDPLSRLVFSKLGISSDGLLVYFTTPIVKIVICLLIFYLINRFAPRVSQLLTGNR